ncbi:MAG: FAD-dependent oxidoreductase, partial [Bacteroidota bacterium]
AIMEQIVAHLKMMYGEEIPPPTQFLRTRWRQNEYTFGSYSFATNGTRSSDFDVFSEPITNQLFFGGEHTIAAYRGTVHGAYLSGLRAARQIMSIAGNYSPFNP